jgi:phenylalanyl-tRNA synthetase alpha chain
MAYAAARGVLRDAGLAEDATQEAFIRAFNRLRSLDDPEAFRGWLRRIVITVAINIRRTRRRTLLRLDDVAELPVLDEAETRWSNPQRLRLASALLTLTREERRVCDRRYHGGWTVARLAQDAGIEEAAMRKRLQRIRDKLRREMEMSEEQAIRPGEMRAGLPEKVLELLARPELTAIPENPVGQTLDRLRSIYAGFDEITLPEIIDFEEARTSIGDDALYIERRELHHLDERRILRYDLTLPLFLTVRYDGRPLRILSAGKTYRACEADAQHLEAFHQAEVLYMDEQARLDPWHVTAHVLQSTNALFPGRPVKIVPTRYTMCREAWELEVEGDSGQWFELMAWGVYSDRIVRHLGGDPARHVAVGIGYGLERLAMLRHGIDDIRRIETAHVA